MKEKWIGATVTDTGHIRNHTRIHDSKEEASSAILKGERPNIHRAYVFKATFEIRAKEAPIEYISLEKDELDVTEELKDNPPEEIKSNDLLNVA